MPSRAQMPPELLRGIIGGLYQVIYGRRHGRCAGQSGTALWVGFEELCGFLAAEPAFASLRCVDVYGAGPEAIANRDRTGVQIVDGLAGLAYRDGLEASELGSKARPGRSTRSFPRASAAATAPISRASPPSSPNFALAPFIGAEAACETAIARGCCG